MTAADIVEVLRLLGGYHSIFVPQFTWRDMRIDAAVIDLRHRWIRGFEVKINRNDFLRDRKWTDYSRFCSSLSIACPEDLVAPDEIEKPFGLLYVLKGGKFRWVKKPKNFHSRHGLAWLWTYVEVLEAELPRLEASLEATLVLARKLEMDLEMCQKNRGWRK